MTGEPYAIQGIEVGNRVAGVVIEQVIVKTVGEFDGHAGMKRTQRTRGCSRVVEMGGDRNQVNASHILVIVVEVFGGAFRPHLEANGAGRFGGRFF